MLLLAFLTFPETAFVRDERSEAGRDSHAFEAKPAAYLGDSDGSEAVPVRDASQNAARGMEMATAAAAATSQAPTKPASVDSRVKKHTYLQTLRVFPQTSLTRESLWTLFVRPLGLVLLPPVLWAALVQSVTIGFLVAVTSNVAPAFRAAYDFQPYQVGLCFVAAVVGSLLGIPAGGHLGDAVADALTRRNGGVRDPEMRLPGMMLCLITTPLALVLFGVGIENKLHWICPTVGLGLRKWQRLQECLTGEIR